MAVAGDQPKLTANGAEHGVGAKHGVMTVEHDQ
jgi:hypothetical protein